MIKLFCDRCGREVQRKEDMHKVEMTNCETGKPSIRPIEICSWCKIEVDQVVQTKTEAK